eukprot:546366_1
MSAKQKILVKPVAREVAAKFLWEEVGKERPEVQSNVDANQWGRPLQYSKILKTLEARPRWNRDYSDSNCFLAMDKETNTIPVSHACYSTYTDDDDPTLTRAHLCSVYTVSRAQKQGYGSAVVA